MTPMIGILSQPLDNELLADPLLKNKTSYIMDTYVKFVESAGGRVVPLLYNDDLESVLEKME